VEVVLKSNVGSAAEQLGLTIDQVVWKTAKIDLVPRFLFTTVHVVQKKQKHPAQDRNNVSTL
jgi:hypothetical protein